jgi:putative membrane protein
MALTAASILLASAPAFALCTASQSTQNGSLCACMTSNGSPGQPIPTGANMLATGSSLAPSSSGNSQVLDDQEFLRSALESSVGRVQLGQLAQQKSQSADIQQFGQLMVRDHTQLNEQVIAPIAMQLGVQGPKGISKKDKQLLSSLSGLSGAQFDEMYIKAMVKDHKQDLKKFNGEAFMALDPNLRRAAKQGTDLISQNLQLIQQIAQNHNVKAALEVEGK